LAEEDDGDVPLRFVAKSPPGSGPVNFDPKGKSYYSCIMQIIAVSRIKESTNEAKVSVPPRTQNGSKSHSTIGQLTVMVKGERNDQRKGSGMGRFGR